MLKSSNWLCLNPSGNITEPSKVRTSLDLDNRGLAYGDGFFTTMGVIDGQILWLDYHHQRLISHASSLHLDLDSLPLLATLQAHAQQLQQGMLKLIVTRAAQDIRGYGYTSNELGRACEIWLKSSAMTIRTSQQLHLPDDRSLPIQPVSTAICLSSQLACLPPPLAGLKSLNRLENVLASAELQGIRSQVSASNAALDIGEGLLRDISGRWVEGTMSNVFYQLSDGQLSEQQSADYLTAGQWYTPSLAQSGVAGVMRQVIIDELSTSKNPVIIRSLQDEDLPQLSQLFFCNALRGVMPMKRLTLLSGEVVGF